MRAGPPSGRVHRGEGGTISPEFQGGTVNRPMLSSSLSLPKPVPWMARAQASLVLLAVLACVRPVQAESHDETGTDGKTVQMLLQRIDQLEARLAKLEAQQTGAAAPNPATAGNPPLTSSPQEASSRADAESDQQMGVGPEPERMDVSKTLLRIRGFGD